MKKSDVLKCQFSSWYSDFKDFTFKSHVINLPCELVDYLRSDGLVLPEGCEDNLQRREFEGDSDDEVEWDSETPVAEGPKFPEFNKQIENTIRALGGNVFPKLNWSAPKDAVWIAMEKNLRCSCPRDIYMLLKSSDFISHDLSHPFDNCIDALPNDIETSQSVSNAIEYELVLRRWVDINPAGEFRCFVIDDQILGICQRQHSAYFSSIPAEKDKICSDITSFFRDHIQGKFPLSKYVFDVYRGEDQVHLVDFNPYGTVTDSLMYTWEELLSDSPLGFDVHSLTDIEPIFRYVESEGQVQSNPYHCYAIPQDFVHLSSGEDPAKLIDFLRMKRQGQNDSSSEDD